MRAVHRLTFIGLMMLGSGEAPASEQLTADEVHRLIDSKGPRGTIEHLWNSPESWEAVMKGIATGHGDWLRIAARLEPASDAGPGEMLVNAVQEALPNNAAGVLRLVKDGVFAVHHACGGYGFKQYEDTRPADVILREIHVRTQAVQAVQVISLATERDACVRELTQVKAKLREVLR